MARTIVRSGIGPAPASLDGPVGYTPRPRESGGTGRRAGFRFQWATREGSSPSFRTSRFGSGACGTIALAELLIHISQFREEGLRSMQVSVESTGTLERRMEVQVPAVEIDKAVDERLQRLSRTVRLKGFPARQGAGQGRAPAVRPAGAPGGARATSVQSSFAEAVEQEKLTPAGGPRIEPITSAPGRSQVPRRVRDRAARSS